jgi:hypothetical protein
MKFICYFVALCLLLQTASAVAQADESAAILKKEQENLIGQLHHTSIDSTIVQGLARFINLKIDSIVYSFYLMMHYLPAKKKKQQGVSRIL